jgi:dCTP deaminase
MGIGVLSNTKILDLINERKIIGSNVKSLIADELDESSLDLRLSTIYYSFKDGQSLSIRHAGVKVASLKDVCSLEEKVIGEKGLPLKPGEVYLFKLEEQLDLPEEISAKASGKSSIGRLDIMTRLLTDDSRQYDIVSAGYKGELFLEVISQIFPIIVRKGDSLLRIY